MTEGRLRRRASGGDLRDDRGHGALAIIRSAAETLGGVTRAGCRPNRELRSVDSQRGCRHRRRGSWVARRSAMLDSRRPVESAPCTEARMCSGAAVRLPHAFGPRIAPSYAGLHVSRVRGVHAGLCSDQASKTRCGVLRRGREGLGLAEHSCPRLASRVHALLGRAR